jgi:hypothetical protein
MTTAAALKADGTVARQQKENRLDALAVAAYDEIDHSLNRHNTLQKQQSIDQEEEEENDHDESSDGEGEEEEDEESESDDELSEQNNVQQHPAVQLPMLYGRDFAPPFMINPFSMLALPPPQQIQQQALDSPTPEYTGSQVFPMVSKGKRTRGLRELNGPGRKCLIWAAIACYYILFY